ncbi:PKD domain-containing protein [bacterium]|nr:PKD domain-containing protein [bacterium]
MLRLHHHLGVSVFACLLALMLFSCGGGTPTVDSALVPVADPGPAALPMDNGWPTVLPVDGVQPWEATDADGNVIDTRAASGINADSFVAAGIETFAESTTGTANNYDALRITSGEPAGNLLSWAIYRLRLGGEQPGVVGFDVNPLAMSDGGQSAYWVGLADYGADCWEWYGPYTDNHVRIPTAARVAAGADYLTGTGNAMALVLAHDGAALDVVAVSANPLSDGDAATPDAPENVTATGVPAGILVSWDEVAAADLAGYYVYLCDAEFTLKDDPRAVSYFIASGGAKFFPGKPISAWVGVTAVDIAGNESALSTVVSATPLAGAMPELLLTASRPSGLIHSAISLTASGAASYDWDLDGDGTFEITDDATGTQPAYTAEAGINRAAVKGTTTGGGIAGAGISILLGTNSRPAASATADPQSGPVPLAVSFTGDAADEEDSLENLTFAWDFDGDGLFEANTDTLTPPDQDYADVGIYNAKLRVEDQAGAWDVDTVAVWAHDPLNHAPTVTLITSTNGGVAPLEVNFEAVANDIDGDQLYFYWDFDGDGVIDFQSFDEYCTHIYTGTTTVMTTVYVRDIHGGSGSAFTLIMSNQAPVAALTATPPAGYAGFTAYLDASGSSDAEGIDNYEWDLDGDGVYSEAGTEADYEGVASFSLPYPTPGEYTATVRVTDGFNVYTGTDTATVDILVHGWVDVPVCTAGGENSDAPLTIVDGRPAFAYCDYTTFDLRFAYSSTADGAAAADWTTVLVDETGNVGRYPSLAVIKGNPAIAYHDESNSNLKYARSNTATGASATDWTQIVTADATASTGTYASLATVAGNPAIAYYDNTDTALKYSRSSTPTGSASGDWAGYFIVDTATDVGRYASLAVVDGNPAIAYMDTNNSALKYARASTNTGALAGDWSTVLEIDNAGTVGYNARLRIVAGTPAIAYTDLSSNAIKFARAVTAAGEDVDDWEQIVFVAIGTNDLTNSALGIVNGHPAVTYRDNMENRLRYIRSTTATGGSEADWTDAHLLGDCDRDTCVTEVNGKPAIVYYVWTTEYEIHYAVCY